MTWSFDVSLKRLYSIGNGWSEPHYCAPTWLEVAFEQTVDAWNIMTSLWYCEWSAEWVYGMMMSSNGNIFHVTGHLCGEFTGPGEFPAQRPVTRSFDVFFDLRLNKWLSKQWRGWWFETLSRPLWRHHNVEHGEWFKIHHHWLWNKMCLNFKATCWNIFH